MLRDALEGMALVLVFFVLLFLSLTVLPRWLGDAKADPLPKLKESATPTTRDVVLYVHSLGEVPPPRPAPKDFVLDPGWVGGACATFMVGDDWRMPTTGKQCRWLSQADVEGYAKAAECFPSDSVLTVDGKRKQLCWVDPHRRFGVIFDGGNGGQIPIEHGTINCFGPGCSLPVTR